MTNKYYENEVCDRLCEAGILAGNNAVDLRVTGFGVTVSKTIKIRPDARKDFSKYVSFNEITYGKVNTLLIVVENCIKHCESRAGIE